MVENSNYLNCLRNGHLEKSAPQGAYALHVHPRLRKRLARCTLDCCFKTSESPALRGFEAERCPIRGTSLYLVLKSNGLRHSKIRLKKFGFSLKTFLANIVKKLPPQRCFKPLFNFSHKRPTFAFTGESAYILTFANRIAHKGSHGGTCVPLCAIFLRKPSVYALSPVKANVGRLCEKLKSEMKSGWGIKFMATTLPDFPHLLIVVVHREPGNVCI